MATTTARPSSAGRLTQQAAGRSASTAHPLAGRPVELLVSLVPGSTRARARSGPGNVTYRAYGARHEQTAQPVRRHHPDRQGGRPSARPRSRSQPARPHRAGTPASSARTRQRRSSVWSPLPRQTGHQGLLSPWLSSPTRSWLRAGSRHPASERPVPAVAAVPAGARAIVPDVVRGADDSGQRDQRAIGSDPRRLTQVG